MPRQTPALGIPAGRLEAIRRPVALPSLTRLLVQAAAPPPEIERESLIRRLRYKAAADGVSLRSLARRAGISWGAWSRLNSGRANLAVWLPSLRAAAARLQA